MILFLYLSKGLTMLATPSRPRVPFSRCMRTSVVSGTCLTQTAMRNFLLSPSPARALYPARAAPSLVSALAISSRWIWLVPSYIWVILASRMYFSMGYSRM